MKALTENSKKWTSVDLRSKLAFAWSGRALLLVSLTLITACQTAPPQTAGAGAATGGSATPSYDKDIAPLLKQKCSTCHGFLIAEKGLRLNSLANIFKGGESGPAVVPGAPQKSPLYTALSLPVSDVRHMPPVAAGPDLNAAQKNLIRDWILAGAN